MDSAFLIAPEVASHPFETLIKGATWWQPGGPNRHYVYFTDAEASTLTGIPERSLRTLQAAELIMATQAPLLAGGFRRVWHLPEAITAAVVEEFKNASGLNYIEASKRLFQAAVTTKLLFAASCMVIDPHSRYPKFSPHLIIAADSVAAIQADAFTQEAFFHGLGWDPDSRFDQDGIWVIAARDRDLEWKALPEDRPTTAAKFTDKLRRANTSVSVNLANVFRQFELKANSIRST